MGCEKTDNADVPLAYVGLRILLVGQDRNSLTNMAVVLQENSFKVTTIEQATVALSILREHIEQFDLVMVDVNMLEMNYLEFIKSTQLIKDKPIILMSQEVTIEMVLEAKTEGALHVLRKSSISSVKLKNVWRHVDWHNKMANEKLQRKANQVDVNDNTACAKNLQDRKGKSIANCSNIYQNQVAGSKRMRSNNEVTQVKICGTSINEEQISHSLLSKKTTKRPEKKRRYLRWTPDLEKKLDEVVRELGEKTPARQILERMCVPDLTMQQITYRLKKYRSPKQQAPTVQLPTSTNINEEHHSNVLNSGDGLFQRANIPQPAEVPFVASQSSNDNSLNWWNEWDEFLEIDDFELK